jgi:hypothetical protein
VALSPVLHELGIQRCLVHDSLCAIRQFTARPNRELGDVEVAPIGDFNGVRPTTAPPLRMSSPAGGAQARPGVPDTREPQCPTVTVQP